METRDDRGSAVSTEPDPQDRTAHADAGSAR